VDLDVLGFMLQNLLAVIKDLVILFEVQFAKSKVASAGHLTFFSWFFIAKG
jgi:hypothetical protein